MLVIDLKCIVTISMEFYIQTLKLFHESMNWFLNSYSTVFEDDTCRYSKRFLGKKEIKLYKCSQNWNSCWKNKNRMKKPSSFSIVQVLYTQQGFDIDPIFVCFFLYELSLPYNTKHNSLEFWINSIQVFNHFSSPISIPLPFHKLLRVPT